MATAIDETGQDTSNTSDTSDTAPTEAAEIVAVGDIASTRSAHGDANLPSLSPASASHGETLLPAQPPAPTLDELKAQKITTLTTQNTTLTTSIAATTAQLSAATATLKYAPAETIKTHIELLHRYNEIRDVGQGLMGIIAENRGVRIGELYGEFGVEVGD